ncbi:MAG: OST-HTH/LOTUS domain-containing protein [Gammaproteobacteria bacterium]|nr:OST-HTH/LOTUS domain-containing protein [Gammaproteobacteria bacterium]
MLLSSLIPDDALEDGNLAEDQSIIPGKAVTMRNGFFAFWTPNKEFGVDSVTAWKPLLLTLLKDRPPEPAARLMQSLVARGNTLELGGFDYKRLGFKRFRNFIEACADILQWEVDNAGTMLVSLRKAAAVDNKLEPSDGASRPIPGVKSDVWIAFANPDPERIRYFNRATGAVFHHRPEDAAVALNKPGPDWVRVDPVDGSVQSGWMKEFIADTDGLDEAAFPMLQLPYRTEVNADFTKALGANGKRWTKYRTHKMIEVICSWARRVGVDPSMLCPAESASSLAPVAPRAEPSPGTLSPRHRAMKLMDALTEDEISSTLIPLMASIIMVKAHR